MRVIRAMSVLALLLLASASARAMGFGAPELKSHLNEPLKLSLPIELSKEERLSRIFVDLASKREYRELGLEPPAYRAAIRVSLERGPDGRPRVNFDSSGPVSDPVLSLLVKARSGRMTYFKHFEVMLDPPPEERSPLSRMATTVVRAQTDDAPRTASVHPTDAPPPVIVRSSWARVDRYGPVRTGDSLSEIAYRLRRDKRYSNRQVMLALYDANPEAFIGGDINRLKNGAWLHVPTAREVERHGGRAAMARLARLLRQSAPSQAATPSTARKKPTGNPAGEDKGNDATTGAVPATSPMPAFRGKVGLGGADAEIAAQIARKRREQLLLEQLKTMSLMFEQSRERERRMERSLSNIEGYVRGLETSVASLREEVRAQQARSRAWILGVLALLTLTLAAFAFTLYRQRLASPAPRERAAPESASTAKPEYEPKPEPDTLTSEEPDPPFPTRIKSDLGENELAIQRLIDRIEEALHHQRLDEARASLDKLDELAPEHLRGRALRAEYLFRAGQRDACRALVDALRKDLDARRWHLFSGMLPREVWHVWDGKDDTPTTPSAANPPDAEAAGTPDDANPPSDLEFSLDLSETDVPDPPDSPRESLAPADLDSLSRTVIIRRKDAN